MYIDLMPVSSTLSMCQTLCSSWRSLTEQNQRSPFLEHQLELSILEITPRIPCPCTWAWSGSASYLVPRNGHSQGYSFGKDGTKSRPYNNLLSTAFAIAEVKTHAQAHRASLLLIQGNGEKV